MKKLIPTLVLTLLTIALSGCLASTRSPVGVNCDYSQEKARWEMPLDCQGGR